MPDVAGDADTPAPGRYTFTVFTPTYNRAHTLQRVYDSLRAQTFRDFEWIVVDDGSTDDTLALVKRWEAEADFDLRLIAQEHGGKHVATNRAVAAARGELFLTADSDDSFVPTALERFKHHWDSIPEGERARFSAVTALVADEHGRLVGTRFPRDPTDSNSLEIHYRYHVRGEKWGFQRTDVMRDHPFPVIPGYRGLVPEGVVWRAIARRYRTRYVNEILRVYWGDQPTRLSGFSDYAAHLEGAMLAYESQLRDDIWWFTCAPLTFFLDAARYARVSFLAGRSAMRQFQALGAWPARTLWAVALPLGWVEYVAEVTGLRRR